jgi:hypothetical protein
MITGDQQHRKWVAVAERADPEECGGPLGTMAVTTSREATEEYVRGDPFFLNGKMTGWYTREWANMFA